VLAVVAELVTLALLFEALLVALALLSGAGTLAGLGAGTALLASATTAGASLAAVVLATGEGEFVDSVTTAGGVAASDATFSGALSVVALSTIAPPMTVAVMTPSAMPK
jgi:hypothetical protein